MYDSYDSFLVNTAPRKLPEKCHSNAMGKSVAEMEQLMVYAQNLGSEHKT